MKRTLAAMLVALLAIPSPALAQESKDVEGSQDHPLLTRMPGYVISLYEVKEFDVYECANLSGPEAKWEGKVTRIDYTRGERAPEVSMAQLERNHQNALTKLGAVFLAQDERELFARLTRGGVTTRVHMAAFNDGRDYRLVIVESAPLQQEVTADAAALGRGIATDGKVAVYGIHFDTGSAVLKVDSEPTLVEIARLLTTTPALSLFVVGHTDAVGAVDANLTLSSARAEAVVKALLGRGIAAARLRAAGVGPYCPVSTNSTEAGRALNRRVELVSQH
jgi:OmpA-OmpF porin, OOP family